MNRPNNDLESQRIRLPLVRTNWVFIVGLPLIFIVLLPYFLSPYVFIGHNPVDDALVALLGETNVKPALYLCIIAGGLIGLVVYRPIHQLYADALRCHTVRVRTLFVFLLSLGPYLGILWSTGVQILWNLAIGPLRNTGNLMSMFFALPGCSFGIVVSIINLVEYYRAKRLAGARGFDLEFTMIKRQRGSYRLELVPVRGGSHKVSVN